MRWKSIQLNQSAYHYHTHTVTSKQTKINQISAPNGSTETIQIYSLITNYLLAESTMKSPTAYGARQGTSFSAFYSVHFCVHYCCRYHFSQTHIHTSRFALITWEHPTVYPGSLRIYMYPCTVIRPDALRMPRNLTVNWINGPPGKDIISAVISYRWLLGESTHGRGCWSHSGQNRELPRLFFFTKHAHFSHIAFGSRTASDSDKQRTERCSSHAFHLQDRGLVLSPCTFQW